jgi:hypothetical protein
MKMTKVLIASMLAVAVCHQAFAQPDPSDSSLALWLNAKSLNLNDGDPVSLWTDLSSHGTTFEPNTMTLDGLDPAEMNPMFVASAPGFNNQPVVRFSRTAGGLGDPNVPFSGGFDRLYQTSNLGAGDPLDIGDGSSLTAFVVYQLNSVAANGEPTNGAFNTVIAKRGTNSAVYSIATHAGTNRYFTISYGGDTAFQSLEAATLDQRNITSLTIEEGGANPDPYTFVENGVTYSSISGAGGFVEPRNASTPEAFALGGHSQICCGYGEWFDGDIAEVIIYDRLLDANETAAINDYLTAKYVPEPGSAMLLLLAGLVGLRARRS